MPLNNKIKREGNNKKGFTIVEIMVVVFIASIISGTVMFRYRAFSDSVELENMALDIVLSVREAQVFGISSRGTTDPTSFFYAYGVSFSTDNLASYVSFVDSSGDNLWYDLPAEQLKEIIFEEKYLINDICVINNVGDSEDCTPARLDILFKRPNVNAIIKTGEGGSNLSSARIELISPSGTKANVYIADSGQVYVE